jgi:AcrR family transcriptional regulator
VHAVHRIESDTVYGASIVTGMPNRASDELVWDEPEEAGSAALTRAGIVAAALELADAEGLEAVSIRRVAAELGVRPMALYSHIASKDDLVALMLHEMSGQLLVPEPLPGDWRTALRLIARRAYDSYVQHPWALQAFGRGTRVGPNMLRRAEQSAAAVSGLDLSPAEAWIALSIVHDWTMGHALHVVTLREDTELEGQLSGADPADFPRMSRVFGVGREQSRDTVFDTALEAVLDGIERRFVARSER